jgi:ferritin-like protein
VSIHWSRAVDNRLTGLAEILIEEPLREDVAMAERHASRLAVRVTQLGGAITAHRTRLVERSQVASVDMPDDASDPAAVLAYPLAQ